MPSENTARILQTLAHNIGLARQFVEGHTADSFASDERTIYAVTRCLEIISEASADCQTKSRHITLRFPGRRSPDRGMFTAMTTRTSSQAFFGTLFTSIWMSWNRL